MRAEDNRPNILFVMIDDLGWMDLACQGNKLVETPHIDRFAAEGMRFTDAYAAAPVCSPTRAAIMTGLSPARLKITNHTPDHKRFTPENAKLLPAFMHNELNADHVTIAQHLKSAGYATGFIGKWHLSGKGKGDPQLNPDKRGFDINIGGCGFGGPPTFFDPYRIPTIENRQKGEYLPYRLADESIKFIRQQNENRFALFLWPYTVHWPMEAPQKLLDKYADRKGRGLNDTRYGAMIEAMDLAFGRILAELKKLNLDNETLVVFTSDNGGFGGVSDCRPLRGEKGFLYEGGIRVPLIIRWPKMIKPGTVCDTPVISMDFFPTLCEVADIDLDDKTGSNIEGVSLVELVRAGKPPQRDAVYFHYPNYAFHGRNRLGSAIRSGDFKLIENFDDQSVELYNLTDDLSEKVNLAQQMPEKAASLRKQLVQWRKSVNAEMPLQRQSEK